MKRVADMTARADDDGAGVVPSNLDLLTETYYNFFFRTFVRQ